MGTHFKLKITVATASGPVDILTENILKIEKASDQGALITYQIPERSESTTVLTVESFVRVLTYFK